MQQRTWNRTLGLVIVVVLVSFPLLRPLTGAHAQQAGGGGDDPLLRELAARLILLGPTLGPDGQPMTIQLLPGEIPNNSPIDLPLPSDAQLIGSAVQSTSDNTPVNVRVVLDVPESADDILSFYDQALATDGFTPSTQGFGLLSQQGGFQAAFQQRSRLYCQGTSGPSVSVSVTPQTSGPNGVMLSASTPLSYPSSCSLSSGGAALVIPSSSSSLPSLSPPPGVRVQQQSIGVPFTGLPNSNATAFTDMNVSDLESSYAQQLEAAGWTPVDNGGDATIAWSTFAVPGDVPAQGFLYVLAAAGQSRRLLHVDVSTATTQPINFAIPG